MGLRLFFLSNFPGATFTYSRLYSWQYNIIFEVSKWVEIISRIFSIFRHHLCLLRVNLFFIKIIISCEKHTNIAWDVPSKFMTLFLDIFKIRVFDWVIKSKFNFKLLIHYLLPKKILWLRHYLNLFHFRQNCSDLTMDQGTMLAHPGRVTHFHEGLPTTSGTRLVLPQLCCSWRSWKWLNEDFNSKLFLLYSSVNSIWLIRL